MIARRRLFAAACAAALFAAAPASALTTGEAEAFVREVADEVRAILDRATVEDPRTEEFLALLRARAALPQIAQFTMGLNWRSMTDAQKTRLVGEFEQYAARVYAARVPEFGDGDIEIVGSVDSGRRGVLVRTRVMEPGEAPFPVEWLVSDRTGDTRLVDVIAEGVSLAISQREEFAAMVARRGGDIDAFIDDLSRLTF